MAELSLSQFGALMFFLGLFIGILATMAARKISQFDWEI